MKDLTLKVFNNFEDEKLIESWSKLQIKSNIFPQMYCGWVKSWCDSRKMIYESKNLYIICIYDENRIIGIAPFCIINIFPGIKVLRSIPIHFGDFFSYIIDINFRNVILKKVSDHLGTFKKWNLVHIYNLNSKNYLYRYLNSKTNFIKKSIVDIYESNFNDLSFEDFLLTLSKNTRNQYNKKTRRLAKRGKIDFECIMEYENYLKEVKAMKSLFNERWKSNNSRNLLNDDYYRMRNKAISSCFENNKAVLYKLSIEGKVIAYRLGFLHNKTFFDWKVIHDINFNYYSPAYLIIGKICEDLINKGFKRLNFMTGEYQYKKSWATNNDDNTNFEYFFAKKMTLSPLYVRYTIYLRPFLRKLYYKIINK